MRVAFACTLVLVASGCATITTGQNQPISVETPGCQGATCKLANDKGTWFVSATPGSATVQRAYGDMTVTCEKGEYRSNPYVFKSSTKAMAFGNVIFGGLIGAAVDAGSGAAYDYPTLISVAMLCSGDPKTIAQPTQPITPDKSGTEANTTTTTPSAQTTTAVNASPPQPAAPPAPVAAPASAIAEPAAPSVGHVEPVSAATSPPSTTSRHMFAAERAARALGCEQPVATMNIQTAASETFTVRCASRDPLSIRCDGSECRELK